MKHLFAIAFVSWMSACTSTTGASKAEVPASPAADDQYAPVLKKWTSEAHVYYQFQKMVDLSAILWSQEMQRAFADRWRNINGNATQPIPTLSENEIGVVMSVYTPDRAYLALENEKLWAFELQVAGQVVRPNRVSLLAERQNQKAAMMPVLPQANSWTREYLVVYQLSGSWNDAELQKAILTASSQIAKATMVWNP